MYNPSLFSDSAISVLPVKDKLTQQTLQMQYKDVFAELPNELPPERTVFHTIPLKEGAEPPPRKSYRLSRPEMQEVDKQVKALLAKGYIRPSSSPYFFFFFFLGGRDIHYKDAMKETTSVCEGHPQQKLQATRTT